MLFSCISLGQQLTGERLLDKAVSHHDPNDSWNSFKGSLRVPLPYQKSNHRFFRDESKPDGEYILLTGEEEIWGIKRPKTRARYYNKYDKYLGTDTLTR